MIPAGEIEAYLSEYAKRKGADTKRISSLRTRLQEGIAYFDGKGITSPTNADYAEWRSVLQATKPGNKKGNFMRPKTSSDWVNDVKGFYNERAGRVQMTIAPEIISGTSPESVAQVEPERAAEMTDVKPARASLGRKPKAENDRRSVKVSIYLTPALYNGVKNIAALSQQDISTVIFSALSNLVDRNADTLKAYETFCASQTIK